MKRLGPPWTDACKLFLPPKRWAALTSAVAAWPLAILLGGGAQAMPEALQAATAAAAPPGQSESEGLALRGRLGAPLRAPQELTALAIAPLEPPPEALAPSLAIIDTAWRASTARETARRAWPPVSAEARAAAAGGTRSEGAGSVLARLPAVEAIEAEAAEAGQLRRGVRSWPAISQSAVETSRSDLSESASMADFAPARSSPAEVADRLEAEGVPREIAADGVPLPQRSARSWPMIQEPMRAASADPSPGDRPSAPIDPSSVEGLSSAAAVGAAAPDAASADMEARAARQSQPAGVAIAASDMIEIIVSPPPPDPSAAASPPRRPRAFPAIAEPSPDFTAFAPVILSDGSVAETLASAVQDALEQNPEIQIAKAQWDDARFGVQESRAALLPSLEVQAARGHERTAPEAGDQSDHSRSELSLLVRQNVYDFGATRGAVRSADRVAASAEWAFRAQVDSVALDIAEAFLQVLEQNSIVTLAEQNLAAHDRILETVQTQQEFGLVTGADVSRVDARLNAARADLLDQRSALEQARENYRRLLNREPGPLAEPGRVEGLIPPTADDAVALLDESNPQVLQARLLLASLDEQREATRAGYLPRFDLELTASTRDNAGGEVGRSDESRAMINMRLPLFDGGAREAAIGRVSARIRQAEFEVERAQRDAEQAVRNDYSALSSAWEKVDAIEDEVAAAERLVELYDEQFRQGTRSVFDLLDGQSTLYQAQVRRESNRTEMRISGYRVLRTLGSLFAAITLPSADIPQLNRPTPRPRPSSDAANAIAHDHPMEISPSETDPPAPAPPESAWRANDTILVLPDPDEPIPAGRRSIAD